MLKITYCREGHSLSDFEARDFLDNEDSLLDYLEGKEEIKVSNGFLMRLIQILIAKKKLSHTAVVFVMNDKEYDFIENGQLKDSLPEDNCFDLAYKMSREFLHCIY